MPKQNRCRQQESKTIKDGYFAFLWSQSCKETLVLFIGSWIFQILSLVRQKIDFQWSLPSWCYSVTHTYYIVLEWSAMSTVWVEHNVNTGILIVNTTPRQQSLSANAPPPSWHITPTLPTSTKIQPKAFLLRMISRSSSFSILSNLLVSSCQHMNETILPGQSARREMAL